MKIRDVGGSKREFGSRESIGEVVAVDEGDLAIDDVDVGSNCSGLQDQLVGEGNFVVPN